MKSNRTTKPLLATQSPQTHICDGQYVGAKDSFIGYLLTGSKWIWDGCIGMASIWIALKLLYLFLVVLFSTLSTKFPCVFVSTSNANRMAFGRAELVSKVFRLFRSKSETDEIHAIVKFHAAAGEVGTSETRKDFLDRVFRNEK